MPALLLRVVFVLLVLPWQFLSAQVTFQKIMGGTDSDGILDVNQTADGGYIFAGFSNSAGGALLMKTDSIGNTLWRKVYGIYADDLRFVSQTPDGGYIAAGRTHNTGNPIYADFFAVRTDADGNLIWAKRYGGNIREWLWSAALTADTGLIMVGYTESFGAGSYDGYVVKVNSSGVIQWTKTIGGSLQDEAIGVKETPEGDFIIAGYALYGGLGDANYSLIKIASNGNLKWSRVLGTGSWEHANAINLTSDGGYVIAGRSSISGSVTHVGLIKTDSSGSILWNKTYGETNDDIPYDVYITSDGGYIICGSRGNVVPGNDAYLIKTDASGNLEWSRAFGNSNYSNFNSTIQTPDNGFLAVGFTHDFGLGSADIYIVKTDSLGNSSCNQLTANTSVSSPSFSVNAGGTVGTGGSEASLNYDDVCAVIRDSVLCTSSSSVVAYELLSASISKTDVTCTGCNDGSVHLTVTGGSGSYMLAWSSGHSTEDLSSLYPGTYMVTVTDIYGCSIADTAVVGGSLLAFQKIYRTDDVERFSDVASAADGGYILAGNYSNTAYTENLALLIKTDVFGNTEWQKTYGENREERFQFVHEISGGGYFAAGRIYASGGSTTNPDFYLVKTNSDGDLQWAKTYGGTGNDLMEESYPTSDGGVVMVGYSTSFGAGGRDVYLVKVDSNGNLQWTKTFGGSGDEGGADVLQANDGGYIVVGTNSNTQLYLIKTDATGNLSWSRFYDILGTTGVSLIQTSDKGYVLAGTMFNPSQDIFLMKTDSIGNVQWSKSHAASGGPDYVSSIESASDGGYIVSGQRGLGANEDFYLIKTDASGNIEWTKAHGGLDEDEIHSVKLTPDGGFICAGQTRSFGGGDIDAFIMKTDRQGNSGCNSLSSVTTISNITFTANTPATSSGTGGTASVSPGIATCAMQLDSVLCSNSLSSVEHQLLSTSVTKTDVTCAGCIDGSIDLTVTGGSGSYTFAWSSGHSTEDVSNLSLETYIVTATDYYGCTITDTATVGGPLLKFQKLYKKTGTEVFRDVALSSEGGYLFSGYFRSGAANGNGAMLVKTDQAGNTIWAKSYGGSKSESLQFVHEIPGTGYFAAGGILEQSGTNSDFYLIKIDYEGDIIWEKSYGYGDDGMWSAKYTADGGVVMCGFTEVTSGNKEVYLAKVDANGTIQWGNTYGTAGNDVGFYVSQTNDEGYIITGFSGNGQLYLIKTDAAGNLSWSKTYKYYDDEQGVVVKQTSDGGYIVSGITGLAGSIPFDIFWLKTDSVGNLQWVRTHNATSTHDYVMCMELTQDGGFIIGGFRGYITPSEDFYLIKVDASGNIQWTTAHGGNISDEMNSLKITPDGGVICAGQTNSFGSGDMDAFIMKTDVSGSSGCNSFSTNTSQSNVSFTVSTPSTSVGSGGSAFSLPGTASCLSYIDSVLCSNSSGSSYSAVWTGSTGSDWFNDANWYPTSIPNSSSNVSIPNVNPNQAPKILVTGLITAAANHVTIQSGAELNIEGELEIYGDLNNSGTISGTGIMHFKNPCNDQNLNGSSTFFNGIVKVAGRSTLHTNNKLFLEPGSSLLHGSGTPGGEGDVIGNISYKQLGQTNPLKWNYWSSPVTGANVSILGSRLYYFDVDSAIGTSLDDIREGWMDASGVMQPGIGYISQGGGTVSFAGPPGNAPAGAPISVSVTKNAVTTVGYNFLGNPFPSAISAQAFVDSNIGTMYGSIYLWDDDASGGPGYNFNDFTIWNGAGTVSGPNTGNPFNGHIATAQGFFAEKITNGNGSIKFTNSMRTTQNDAFFRLAPIERLWMNIIGPDSAYNETLIAFLDDATDSMDIRYDAKKFFGEDNIAFYSLLDGKSCAIQSFPPLENNRTVQLGVNAGADGDYIINLKKVETLDETVVILLEDTLTGNMYNLRVDSSHTFHVAKGNDNGRFLLHFNPQMLISTQQEGCAGNDGQIFIEQPGSYDWDFILKDESGFVVDSVKNFNGSALYSGLEGGRYVLILDDRYGYSVTKYIELDAKEKVTAGFEISNPVFHAGDSITLHNTSVGALQYEWNFGDSITSYAEHPTHVYSFPGVYSINLNARNNECNDEYSVGVQVLKLFTGTSPMDTERIKIFSYGDKIYVDFRMKEAVEARIEVFDLIGRRMLDIKTHSTGTYMLDFQSKPSACFLVKTTTLKGDVKRERVFVVNK